MFGSANDRFGDVLAIGRQEVWLSALLFFVMGPGIFVFLNALSLITLQEELAHVCGVPVRALNYAFVIALTLTVTRSPTVRLIGKRPQSISGATPSMTTRDGGPSACGTD